VIRRAGSAALDLLGFGGGGLVLEPALLDELDRRGLQLVIDRLQHLDGLQRGKPKANGESK